MRKITTKKVLKATLKTFNQHLYYLINGKLELADSMEHLKNHVASLPYDPKGYVLMPIAVSSLESITGVIEDPNESWSDYTTDDLDCFSQLYRLNPDTKGLHSQKTQERLTRYVNTNNIEIPENLRSWAGGYRKCSVELLVLAGCMLYCSMHSDYTILSRVPLLFTGKDSPANSKEKALCELYNKANIIINQPTTNGKRKNYDRRIIVGTLISLENNKFSGIPGKMYSSDDLKRAQEFVYSVIMAA